MGQRVIFHCDLNCFFASVELLDKPALWDVPVAVCGDPKSRHGIILAKNEPAKKRGVQTAETVWQAKKKCPVLVLLPPHHELYEVYSRRVNEIYGRFTDLVEPFGIDESWLDVTGSLHLFGGDARALADRIRETVEAETGLTVSVGVSFNKVFAKLGSDLKISCGRCRWGICCLPGAAPSGCWGSTALRPSGSWRRARRKWRSSCWARWAGSCGGMPTGWTTAP